VRGSVELLHGSATGFYDNYRPSALEIWHASIMGGFATLLRGWDWLTLPMRRAVTATLTKAALRSNIGSCLGFLCRLGDPGHGRIAGRNAPVTNDEAGPAPRLAFSKSWRGLWARTSELLLTIELVTVSSPFDFVKQREMRLSVVYLHCFAAR
jgi:hypothetical protein